MTDTISGSFIMTYVPNEDETNVSCKISLVGWRGEKSCRLYIGKHDRVHYLHLLGMNLQGGPKFYKIFLGVKELPEWLKMQTNTRRQRQANRKDDRDVQEEEEKKNGETNDENKKDDREPETNGKTEQNNLMMENE